MKPEDPLDPVLEDARVYVQAQMAAGGRVRDFAAMIACARAIAPGAVSARALAEVADYAPVVVLRRVVAPPEPATLVRPAAPRRVSLRAWWFGVGVAAALVLLGFAGAASLARPSEAPYSGDAVQHVGPVPAHNEARVAPVEALRRPPKRPSVEELRPAEILDDTAKTVIAEPAAASVLPPRASVRVAAKSAPTGAELDRLAREAWRRDDLDEARRLFALLVATDSDARRVELAFGDLLVLARHAGDPRGLARARRAYLERFPGGIYADDASAGLCRGAVDAASCWRRYLGDRPAGAHVEEARRVLGEPDDSP